MNNYDFFIIEGTTLFGSIINAALLGGLVYLTVRVVRTVLKRQKIKITNKRRYINMNVQAVNSDFRLMSSLDLKNSDMPVIDFADFLVESGMFSSREELSEYIKRTSIPYVEGSEDFYPNGSIHSETPEEYRKRMERNAQNFDRSNIAVINIPDYEYYTGNEGYTSCVQGDPSDPMIAAQNRAVNYGMRYKSSCFDFTNQNDYLALTKSADYTGMTAAEKYRAIYEKYQHCYGRNFLDALAINYTAPMQNDPYTELCEKFETEIANVCGLSGDYSERAEQLRQLRREALYGEEASDEEVRQMITEKYPPMGEITFRDFYKMTNEMEMCGAGGHVNNCIGEIFSSVGGYYSNGSGGYDLRENMMDTKVTFDHLRFMQKSYNGRLSSGISMHPDFGTVLNELMAAYRSSSANERSRSAISNSLLEEMRSRSVGVRASV